MAPLEIDADHAELKAVARRVRVAIYINWRARQAGRPWVELFARDMQLSVHWDFRDAAAWLQPGQEASHGQR
jgi:hypothetical protein